MTAYSKQLIIFDLGGTLALSKSAMDGGMADLLVRLLEQKKVAIISGNWFPEFMTKVLALMPANSERFNNLLLMPTSGTRLSAWRGSWAEQYAEHLSPREKEKIMMSLNSALRGGGYETPTKTYGPVIEDRGSQITFSALGQSAPYESKLAWDPSRAKREKIVSILAPQLPEFDIRIGGTTSIDITRRGVNKGYGIRKLEEYLKMPLDHMIFVGNELAHGGNDFPAKATGIDCIEVSGPEDTKRLIESWVA